MEVNESSIKSKLDKIIENIAFEIFTKSQENLVKNGRIDTGSLLRSGTVDKINDLNYKITYDAPHSTSIEYGSIPHSVPIDPLEGWVKRKLRVKNKESRNIAWAIHSKIKKEGTEPHPFLRPAVNTIKSKYRII